MSHFYRKKLKAICFTLFVLLLVGCSPQAVENAIEPLSAVDFVLLDDDMVVSAEVMLISASGKVIDENSVITSENVADYLPDPDTLQTVATYFEEQGFNVFEFETGLTVAGTTALFTEQFDALLISDRMGEMSVQLDSGEITDSLPLADLPYAVQEQISVMTFIPPPELDGE